MGVAVDLIRSEQQLNASRVRMKAYVASEIAINALPPVGQRVKPGFHERAAVVSIACWLASHCPTKLNPPAPPTHTHYFKPSPLPSISHLPLVRQAKSILAMDLAAAAPPPSLTFAWLGEPKPDGDYQFYHSFQFCNTTYVIGDHVYLTPEDPGAPLYLARIIHAFEDAQQQGGDRLCIEVSRGPPLAALRARVTSGIAAKGSYHLITQQPEGRQLILLSLLQQPMGR